MGDGNSGGGIIMVDDHQGSSISTLNLVLGLRGSLLSWINRLFAAAPLDSLMMIGGQLPPKIGVSYLLSCC
jgi:hypothetical protein